MSDFSPCPFCKQYSHSIPEDRVGLAFRHFETMYAHPLHGRPMGQIFDEQTRDYAQVLVAAARSVRCEGCDGFGMLHNHPCPVIASGMSASGQDAERLEAKPASPTPKGDAQ